MMLYFVVPRGLKKSSKSLNYGDINKGIVIMTMAKKMGLSFDELNMMNMQEFSDFTELWCSDFDIPREATDEDIDFFIKNM